LHGDEIVIRNYESTRDYIHVSDVVSALILAAKSKYAGVYNVSSGIETSLRQILEIIVETISPTPVKLVEEEQNSFEIVYSALSNLSFRETFLWNPKTNVQSGIKQMLEHFKSP
jgi:UDP-glucose 4-epimerase